LLAEAAEVLRRGGLVAFPTETVYGLGGRALDPSAILRIYDAKGRPAWNPLIAHVADVHMARACLVAAWPDLAETLARRFWPGPLTLVLPRAPGLPLALTAGLDRVAVRVPNHAVALGLIRALGEPVAAPSANRFTGISPTTADHVERQLGEAVDLVLDGGGCGVGVESTVVDVTADTPVVLRPGGVAVEDLARVAPGVAWGVAAPPPDGLARPSPGTAARHYAPRAQVRLVAHGDGAGWRRGGAELARPLGALSFSLPTLGVDHAVTLPSDPGAAQRALYAALHDLEDRGCAAILVEMPPQGPGWDAVRDRLTRAGG
jgi:L-threonylcarbamoyladenylate synthase